MDLGKNLVFYLPRNTDVAELIEILVDKDKRIDEDMERSIMLDIRFLKSAGKVKAMLVLYGPNFMSVKIKQMRDYLTKYLLKFDSFYLGEIKLNNQRKKLSELIHS